MLKRGFIILCLFLAFLSVSAKERTWTEKRAIALNVLSEKDVKTRAEELQLSELYTTKAISVVGSREHGFVIIANNDEYQPVLGYSVSSFDKEDFSEGMLWWMNAITEAMDNPLNNISSSSLLASSTSFATEVEPLITTTWNQNNPYNYLCPSMASKGNYPSGCVATALSQIMNYHKYPNHGKGSFSYVFRPDDATAQQLTANFEETYYDWDNMLDTYSRGYNDAQRDAVATLMLHCGISVQMAYTSTGSGAYAVEATQALRKYFCYNENVRLYDRRFYTAELWMQMLYTELNNKRPVYYKGQDTNGGHAFVIDGYDKDGLVHVNWGWGGKDDGFFEIALLNPSGSKFSEYQAMIANICTPDVQTTYESQLVSDGLSISLYGSTTKRLSLSAKVYAIGADDFEGKVAAILQNSENTIVAKVQEGIVLHPASLGFMQGEDVALRSIDLTDIPDGTYRVFMGCMCEKDTKWQLVRPYEGETNSCILVKSGNECTITKIIDDLWTGISNVEKDINKNNRIYGIQGQSYSSSYYLPKGIYIIGGKKVVK